MSNSKKWWQFWKSIDSGNQDDGVKSHHIDKQKYKNVDPKIEKRKIEKLIQELKVNHPETCRNAARALGEIGDRRALIPLMDVLYSKREFVSKTVSKAIKKLQSMPVRIDEEKLRSKLETMSQDEIYALTQNEMDIDVRQFAIGMLDDELLKKVALNEKFLENREFAIKKISNQKYLLEIANVLDKDFHAANHTAKDCLNIDNKIIEMFVNFEIKNSALSVKIIQSCSDDSVLLNIITNEAFSLYVREKALENINIKANIPKLLEANLPKEFICKIVEHIDDYQLLLDIAKKNNDYNITERAIGKIKDERFLFDTVMSNVENQIKDRAISGIKNQQLLFDIVMSGINSRFLKSAIREIKDEQLLFNIAMSENDNQLREEAIRKIKNEQFLFDIIMNDRTRTFSETSVNGRDQRLQEMVIDKISDDEKLYTIAFSDIDALISKESSPLFKRGFIERKAIFKIKDKDLISNIISKFPILFTRKNESSKLCPKCLWITFNFKEKDGSGNCSTCGYWILDKWSTNCPKCGVIAFHGNPWGSGSCGSCGHTQDG